jgi:hypothetical protein
MGRGGAGPGVLPERTQVDGAGQAMVAMAGAKASMAVASPPGAALTRLSPARREASAAGLSGRSGRLAIATRNRPESLRFQMLPTRWSEPQMGGNSTASSAPLICACPWKLIGAPSAADSAWRMPTLRATPPLIVSSLSTPARLRA